MKLMPYAFLSLTMTTFLVGQPSYAQEGWALAKNAEGIKVYVRSLADSALHEFRGEVELKGSPETIVQVLRNANAFQQWMPDVAVSSLLASTDSEQYHYMDNKAPWPVSNRDGVFHFTYSRLSDGSVTVQVEAAPTYVPVRDGKVRIPKANGQWRLVPRGSNVQVTYQMLAEPGGAIPNWLANQTVVDTPYATLKGLRAYLSAR